MSAIPTFQELQPLWPELLLAVSTMVLLVYGVFRGNDSTSFVIKMSVGLCIVLAVLLFKTPIEEVSLLNNAFVFDGFAYFVKFILLAGMSLAFILSYRYLQEEQMARFEYPVLMLFAALGMFIMVSADSLLTLYVGLELQSLSLYVLAAFRREAVRSTEAGIKYFVLGALSSGLVLFGISLLYGFTGVLGFGDIAVALPNLELIERQGVLFGLMFLLAGLAFKVSAVPFHMWTPDVYEGAPTPVTAFFAMVPKIAALALLMRLFAEPFYFVFELAQPALIFLSVMSMIWAAFAGLVQKNIKRLMAYSSIGNMGYALIGLVVGGAEGHAAALYYAALYMAMTAGVFAIIMCMRRSGISLKEIDDLKGLSKNHPLLAYSLTILMLSIMGIPPFSGFWGKLFIFEAAVSADMILLAVIGVVTSVIAAFYYLRIIAVMFFDEEDDPFEGKWGFS